MHLAMEDETLEFRFRKSGQWNTFRPYFDKYVDVMSLSKKVWSIRKRESNLDKAVEELKETPFSEEVLKEILSKYIKD